MCFGPPVGKRKTVSTRGKSDLHVKRPKYLWHSRWLSNTFIMMRQKAYCVKNDGQIMESFFVSRRHIVMIHTQPMTLTRCLQRYRKKYPGSQLKGLLLTRAGLPLKFIKNFHSSNNDSTGLPNYTTTDTSTVTLSNFFDPETKQNK